ncbi:hypothetical protein ACFFRR_005501 [Megaselia abdita]
MNIKAVNPGFNQDVLCRNKKIVNEQMTEKDKNVIITFDEMAIEECLEYEQSKDIIFGMVNFGDRNVSDELGKLFLYCELRMKKKYETFVIEFSFVEFNNHVYESFFVLQLDIFVFLW